MGPISYILLFLTVLLAVEVVLEARKKRWLGMLISLTILALLVYMTSPIYRTLWQKISPTPKATGTP